MKARVHKRLRLLLCVLPTLFLALALPGCGRGGAASEDGATEGPRIVALSPAIAIMLIDLGAEDRIVGRHAFDLALPRSVRVVGDQSGIDYETLLRLNPTHVVLERGAGPLPPRLRDLAERRGWTLVQHPMLTLDDIRGALGALPEALDLGPEAGARRDALLARMDEVWRVREGFGERVGRALILYSTEPIGAAGPGSFHAQLLESMGGALAFDRGAPYIALDAEDARRLDPDSVILMIPGADPERIDDLLAPLRRAGLRAVAEGRFALIHHPHCQTPSTAMIEVAELLDDTTGGWPSSGGAAVRSPP